MQFTPTKVLRVYVVLTWLSTFASSLIWGVNTLFLLDAKLSVTQAFAANAFFTLGQVLFELPTGVVADTVGRRMSYLLGTATLLVTTLLYLLLWQTHATFWLWAVVSALLGLGFTFFSGATEAWLVDALFATQYQGTLDAAFAKGQIASGVAMLSGTLAGGVLAQLTSLGLPYIVRSVALGVTFFVALAFMHDVGFTPRKDTSLAAGISANMQASLQFGLRNVKVRWLMLAAPFGGGVGIYVFYAMQPYLLELSGKTDSYATAGLAAAIVAAMQIVGGVVIGHIPKFLERRTSLLILGTLVSSGALVIVGVVTHFWLVLLLLAVWAFIFAASAPVRQAYLNQLIPSEQRATVLSSDNLLSSLGGVGIQPCLGKVADIYGYAISYVVSACFAILALPLIMLARRENAPSDWIIEKNA